MYFLQIKQQGSPNNYDKINNETSWGAQSEQQFVSLNQYLNQQFSILQRNEINIKKSKNSLLYLLDSQYGIVDYQKMVKNNTEEFIAVLQQNEILKSSQQQKTYKLKMTQVKSDTQTGVNSLPAEENSSLKCYKKCTEILNMKLIKNLGHVIIGINQLIPKMQYEQQTTAQLALHKAVTSLNYVYNSHDYLSFQNGQFKFKFSQFTLSNLISDIKTIYSIALQKFNIQFQIDHKQSISKTEQFYIFSDKRRTIQTIINMVNLALRNIYMNRKHLQDQFLLKQKITNSTFEQKQINNQQEFIKIVFSRAIKKNIDTLKISIIDSACKNYIEDIQNSLESIKSLKQLKDTKNIHSLNMSKLQLLVSSQVIQRIGPMDKILSKNVDKQFNKTNLFLNIDCRYIQNIYSQNESFNTKSCNQADPGFKLSQRPQNSQITSTYLYSDNEESSIINTQHNDDVNEEALKENNSLQEIRVIANEQINQKTFNINPVLVTKYNFENAFTKSSSSTPQIIRSKGRKQESQAQSPSQYDQMSSQMKNILPQISKFNKDAIYSSDKFGFDQNDSHVKFIEKDISYNNTSFNTDYKDVLQMTMNDNNATDIYGSKQTESLNQQTFNFQEIILSKKNTIQNINNN